MPETSLTCDQAIFTSVRTPTGEGYHIVAASRGLQVDEKQAITRNSPSHEGLCPPSATADGNESPVVGATFNPLPSGRLCVALSCFAGAEHTGRGGQRVYTHNVVFAPDEFARCGFNAFNVLRSMVTAGLASPQLSPSPVLPELQLPVVDSPVPDETPTPHPSLHSALRRRILAGLFDDQRMIVNIADHWLQSTEVFLLGLPGPLRAKISFGAGLRFSASRAHHLDILHDKKGLSKRRIAGQPVEYLDPENVSHSSIIDSSWIVFVDRHWESGDIRTLADRTSRAFTDVTPCGCERVGALYNDIDSIPETSFEQLLRKAANRLSDRGNGIEHNIAAEFVAKAKVDLGKRLSRGGWADAKRHWPTLVNLWQSSDCGAVFTQPLIHETLRAAVKEDPISAAEVALQVARDIPAGIDRQVHDAVLDDVLNGLVIHCGNTHSGNEPRLRQLYEQWRGVRPQCSLLDRIREQSAEPVAPSGNAKYRHSYP